MATVRRKKKRTTMTMTTMTTTICLQRKGQVLVEREELAVEETRFR
jgi:hypothetical protein